MPYELLTGKQFPGPGAGGVRTDTSTPFLSYKPYYDQLMALVSSFSTQAAEAKGGEQQGTPSGCC